MAPNTAGQGDGDQQPTGGRVRVAALGSPTDALDPRTYSGFADYIAFHHLYDSLVLLQGDRLELALAESVEPNTDASIWTVRLPEGVTFHDGRPLGAGDVAYSLRTLGDPDQSPNLSAIYVDIDMDAMQVLDERTLRVPLMRARGDFVEGVIGQISFVFPDGTTDFTAGIGSGPFRLDAYELGGAARLVRNDEYWGDVALLDELETVPIADPAARLNALKSGEVEYATSITAAGAAAETANDAVRIRRGGPANGLALAFAMNVTAAPFDDPDVRRAFRLAVDRQALVDAVLLGEGTVGNDLVGLGLPGYAADIAQRERDVDEARRLLEGAGVDQVTVRAADITPGIVDAAELFAEQLAEVGVDLRIDEVPAETYFDDFVTVLSTPFQGAYFINRPASVIASTFTGSAATFNLTGFADPAYDELLAEAQATVDDAERAARFLEVQQILHDEGGDIVWGYQEQLDATVRGLEGVGVTQQVPVLVRASLRR